MRAGESISESALRSVPKAGELIAGKYRVEQVLAAGGMGVVVEGRHEELGQRVAIKFLFGESLANEELVTRFIREARAAAGLHGEHVVRVLDVGRLETGAPYMVMELLRGVDLRAQIERLGVLPVRDAVDYVLQACEALAEAHAIGIVHRDIKPSNLFLASRPDGSPLIKVLDFGISKVLSDSITNTEKSLTATMAVMGSPQYMSPEQVRNVRRADVRSDIWSLGVTLYELLSAEVPFDAETVPALSAMIVADPATPLRQRCPSVPSEVEAIVMRCLEKDPAARYQSVADLARALAPFASQTGVLHMERAVRISKSAITDQGPPARVLPVRRELQEAATVAVSSSDVSVSASGQKDAAVSGTKGASTLRSAGAPAVSGHGDAENDGTLAATSRSAETRVRAGRIGVWLGIGSVAAAAVAGVWRWTTHAPQAHAGSVETGAAGIAPAPSVEARADTSTVPSAPMLATASSPSGELDAAPAVGSTRRPIALPPARTRNSHPTHDVPSQVAQPRALAPAPVELDPLGDRK